MKKDVQKPTTLHDSIEDWQSRGIIGKTHDPRPEPGIIGMGKLPFSFFSELNAGHRVGEGPIHDSLATSLNFETFRRTQDGRRMPLFDQSLPDPFKSPLQPCIEMLLEKSPLITEMDFRLMTVGMQSFMLLSATEIDSPRALKGALLDRASLIDNLNYVSAIVSGAVWIFAHSKRAYIDDVDCYYPRGCTYCGDAMSLEAGKRELYVCADPYCIWLTFIGIVRLGGVHHCCFRTDSGALQLSKVIRRHTLQLSHMRRHP